MPHTPGPWFVRGEPHGLRCVVDGKSAYIVDRFKLGSRTDEEHAANARLISAAPDLLAACKSVEWSCSDRDEDGVPYWSCPYCGAPKEDGHEDGCALAAAIAKAEGRA